MDLSGSAYLLSIVHAIRPQSSVSILHIPKHPTKKNNQQRDNFERVKASTSLDVKSCLINEIESKRRPVRMSNPNAYCTNQRRHRANDGNYCRHRATRLQVPASLKRAAECQQICAAKSEGGYYKDSSLSIRSSASRKSARV